MTFRDGASTSASSSRQVRLNVHCTANLKPTRLELSHRGRRWKEPRKTNKRDSNKASQMTSETVERQDDGFSRITRIPFLLAERMRREQSALAAKEDGGGQAILDVRSPAPQARQLPRSPRSATRPQRRRPLLTYVHTYGRSVPG